MCILFLDLGQVLELNGLTLEDAALHILDQLLLLFPKKLILQLHSMDFLLHSHDFCLSNRWIQGILHLFLELVFALPKKDLLLCLNHFNQDVTLLLFELRDLVLKLDRLVFHLFELLLELHFNVEVVIRESLLALIVLINQIVELVHLEDLVLLCDLQLVNVLVVRFNF